MDYDEPFSERIAELTKRKRGFTHKEMFGGIAYLLNSSMFVGVHKNQLRHHPKNDDQITTNKDVRPFDITGRPMIGREFDSEGVKGNGLNECPPAGRPRFEFSISQNHYFQKNNYGP